MLSIKNCLDHKKWSLITTCGWRRGAEKWVPVSTVNKEIRAKRVKWVNFFFTSTYHSPARQNCPHSHCHGHKPKILECTAGCHSDTHSQSKVWVL